MALPSKFEPIGSRAFAGQTCVMRFTYPEEYDTEAVKADVLATSPTTFAGFKRNAKATRVEQQDNGMVVAEVEYVHPSQEDNGPQTPDDPSQVSFDTTGGSLRVTQKKQLRDWALNVSGFSGGGDDHGKYLQPGFVIATPSGWVLKDQYLFDGAIGVTPDHDVEGVDVVIPKLALSYTKLFHVSDVDAAFIKTLARMTGTTNNDTFKGFDAEELLFMGARGNLAGAYFQIEFVFDASENIDDFTVPGTEFRPDPIVKKGHDYLWVWYTRVANNGEDLVKPRPMIAYVDRLYDTTNFADLGIGT